MANLRKRVAACDLEKKRPVPNDAANDEADGSSSRPLLSNVSGNFSS